MIHFRSESVNLGEVLNPFFVDLLAHLDLRLFVVFVVDALILLESGRKRLPNNKGD